MHETKCLWRPDADHAASTHMARFMAFVSTHHSVDVADSRALHQFSISQPAQFWSAIWDYCGVIGHKGETVLTDDKKMRKPDGRPQAFFADAKLNFAENLLQGDDNFEALVFWGEDKVKRRMSRAELKAMVSSLQQYLQSENLEAGDRVAAMMPNLPETIALMLACASMGVVFSSCSPDFGVQGVLDRFVQIEPKLFVACDGVWYNGKKISITERVAEIAAKLPGAPPCLIVPYIDASSTAQTAQNGFSTLGDIVARFPAKPLEFVPVDFNHPLFILFSSGTTGIPKCIVHNTGGPLLQLMKEHQLHCDIRRGDRVFYYTTCGWMMWNWLVTGLASGATLLLYDGSPFAASEKILFDYAQDERMTLFGTSAKYIEGLRKADVAPKLTHDLSQLRTMTSTGSPLSDDGFEYVYRAIKTDLHLASISGGTDIVSCFVLGDPTQPVYRGEIQSAGLGMAVDVFNEEGRPVPAGVKGELVCTKAFPCMPIKFWNDPEGKKYSAAYFERFENVWCHGDFAEWTANGGIIIHGRSDTTLNPGGVRIGTAEIYAQVEKIPDVLESLCIGQDFDDDVRVVLFVKLKSGVVLDDALKAQIKAQIRNGASPRHVPAKIIAVADLPRTKSGKLVELAVRSIVHGQPVKNSEALANPEALALFKDLKELQI